MPKCNFNKVAKQLYSNHISARVFSCGNVNLLHICRTTFPKNTFGGLLLSLPCLIKMINDSPQARKFFKRKIEALQYPIFLEFAKLRASRAFAPSCLRAPYVPLCFRTLRALLTHLIFAPGVPFHSPCTPYLCVLKEIRNCIARIIRVRLLFCSIRVYTSLHFLPILLGN